MKSKKCKICHKLFQPVRSIQPCCRYECEVIHAVALVNKFKINRERIQRKETKITREGIKTLTEWLKDAEKACHKYIRMRDRNEPCISCGTTNPNIQYAAGHFRSVKAASHLRFNENNIHKQCNFHCNSQLSGNISNYRPNLIKKIGLERVEELENDNTVHRWTIDEAKKIRVKYTIKIKELENEK